MFILTRHETDCEGYFNMESALCVSESKEALTNYHAKNEGGNLLNEGEDYRSWCKKNSKPNDYYKGSYCTIGEIKLLS